MWGHSLPAQLSSCVRLPQQQATTCRDVVGRSPPGLPLGHCKAPFRFGASPAPSKAPAAAAKPGQAAAAKATAEPCKPKAKALRANACDFVMPDFMRIGGVTGWMQSAGIAAAAGIPISTHLYPEVGAHVMRVSETAHWLEWQDWAEPILREPYVVPR